MKTCYRCKTELPCTNEYFAKDKSTKTGLTSWCKECLNEYARLRTKKNRTTATEYKKRKPNTIQIDLEVDMIPIPKVNMFKGTNYKIIVPRQGKGTEHRVITGEVIQATDSIIIVKTKNYIESFSRWELSKYKIMEA